MSNAIVYFTHTGENNWSGENSDRSENSTQRLAQMVQDAVGGDLIELQPVDAYPVDYDALVARTRAEQAENARPALKALPDLAGYDVVFLGFPCWWGTVPMPVMTFLENESLHLVGKVVAPFCTNEGSGMGRSEKDVKAACPDADVRRGLAIDGNDIDAAFDRVDYWAHKVLEA